jgi:hypothetical protein
MKKILSFLTLLMLCAVGVNAQEQEPVEINTMEIRGTFPGMSWNEGIAMTVEEDGVWYLNLTGVELAAENYECKATANGNWSDYVLPSGDNYIVSISEAGVYDLVFRVSTKTHTLTVQAQKQAQFTNLLTLPGDAAYTAGKFFIIEAEGAANIIVKAGETTLTAVMEDGIAAVQIQGEAFTEGDFVIAADKQIEIAKVSIAEDVEGDWTQIWPEEEQPLVIENMVIVGTFPGMSWDAAKGIAMEADADGYWYLYQNGVELEAGTYEYKAVGNGDYNIYQLPASGNNNYVINEAGVYDLIFEANTVKHTLKLTAQKQAASELFELLTLAGDAAYEAGKFFLIEAEGSANITVKAGETTLTAVMEDGIAMVEIEGSAFTAGTFTIFADKEITLTKVSLFENPDATTGTQIWPAAVEPFDYTAIAITPADRSEVESLKNFTLTFGDQIVTVNDQPSIVLLSNNEEVAHGIISLNADGSALVSLDQDVTAPGNYQLNIENAILFNGTAIDPLSFKYTIAGMADFTINPAEGKVESLSTFTITFNNYSVELTEEANAYLFNRETEDEIAADVYETGGGTSLYVELNEEITASGEWQLNIEGAKRMDTDEAVELIFDYTIENPNEIRTMAIVGDFTGGWDLEKAVAMQQNDETNIWTLYLEGVQIEAKKYEYKAVANGSWDAYQLPASGNQDFVFGTEDYPAGIYNLLFTVDTEAHTLTLVVEKQAEPAEGTTLTLAGNATYTEGKAFMIEAADEASATLTITAGEFTYEEIMEDGVAMFVIQNDAFLTGDFTIKADKEITFTKVTLLPNADAASGTQIWPEIPTGITNVAAAQSVVIFNLQGVRLNKAQKGINIINGKKVMK